MIDPKTLADLPEDAATRTEFKDTLIPMAKLAEQMLKAGRMTGFDGVTFTNCIIQGPAVLVPGTSTMFDGCNLGHVNGDVRNLFLLAVGPMITGAVPVNGCRFDKCEFRGIGFAGEKGFVDHFVGELSKTSETA